MRKSVAIAPIFDETSRTKVSPNAEGRKSTPYLELRPQHVSGMFPAPTRKRANLKSSRSEADNGVDCNSNFNREKEMAANALNTCAPTYERALWSAFGGFLRRLL